MTVAPVVRAPRGDPLLDTLFRGTSGTRSPSAAPARQVGTRSRAGNAMLRTRAALLEGARRAVEASGAKVTMSQIAVCAEVAKATLYNHFRTRESVLAALLDDEVSRLAERLADWPLRDALCEAATTISRHRLLRVLARHDPEVLLALARVDLRKDGWRIARDVTAQALSSADRSGTDTVLRWLGSFMVNPADSDRIAADVDVLLAGLPTSGLPTSTMTQA